MRRLAAPLSRMVETVASGGTSRLAGLDMLRFAAAAMVVVFHLGAPAHPRILTRQIAHAGLNLPHPQAVLPAAFGWVGVQIFFVISGFVIAYSASRSTPGQFLRSRFLRLAPALFVCALISAAVMMAYGTAPVRVADLLWRSWVLWPTGPWIDGVYWTLTIEVVFYAAVWLLLVLGAFRRIELLTCVIGLVVVACDVIVGWRLVPGLTLSNFPYLHHGVHFALGIMLWLIFFEGASLRRWAFAAVFVFGGACEIAAAARVEDQAALIPILVWSLAVAAIALSAAFRDRLGRFAPRVRLIGLATYPLYLLHADIGLVCLGALYALGLAPAPAFVLVVTGVVVFSFLVACLIEPLLRAALASGWDRLAGARRTRLPRSGGA